MAKLFPCTFLIILTLFQARAKGESIAVSAVPSPSAYGQPVTLTATVDPATSAGTIAFYDGVQFLGSAPVSGGSATLRTSEIGSGQRSLTARFHPSGGTNSVVSVPTLTTVSTAPGASFNPKATLIPGQQATWVAAGDLNGDGKPDLVAVVYSPNTGSFSFVAILLGNGDGSFQSPLYYVAGTDLASVAIGDLNGDGIPDLICADEGDPFAYPSVPSTVNVLLGSGGGTFSPPLLFPARDSAYETVIADFNADGNPDVAIANFQDSQDVSIYLGNGDGTLGTRIDYATGTPNGAFGLAVGDYNKDGIPDIAVAEDNVVILYGRGDGSFQSAGTYSVGSLPADVQTADFNGDGNPDLAVANFFDGSVSVLLGNGDGTFQAQHAYAAQTNSAFVSLADYNGDGKIDIAVANAFSGAVGSISVFAGNGDGTFQSAANYTTGPGPYVLAQGDFAGSGAPSLVTADYGDGLSQPGDLSMFFASACLSVAPPSTTSFDGSGGTATFTINASKSSCTWTASTDSVWISLPVTSGSGAGNISILVADNDSGSDRSGTVVLGGVSTQITQSSMTQQFSDVGPSSPFFDAVNLLKADGVTSGCSSTQFCPDQNVTRDQMAIFLVRAVYGGDTFPYSPTPYFQDVPSTAFGFAWIQKLYELGITAGCGPQLYCPQNPVTRSQMAVFLIRARYGTSTPFSWSTTPFFTDVPSNAFGFQWIQRLRQDGITAGCGSALFCPDSNVTRGEMAVFITRGSFNQGLPANTPLVLQMSPRTLPIGKFASYNVNGLNTHFQQGVTTLVTPPGLAFSNLTILSPTQFTVTLAAATTIASSPVSIYVRTGSEEAVLPAGLSIQ